MTDTLQTLEKDLSHIRDYIHSCNTLEQLENLNTMLVERLKRNKVILEEGELPVLNREVNITFKKLHNMEGELKNNNNN